MLDTILLIVFSGSLLGILAMLTLKIPALLELEKVKAQPLDWKRMVSKTKEGLRKTPPLRKISFSMMLQRVLSKTRVITLKTDQRTSDWLQHLREQSQKNKFGANDNYWKEIRKSTKGK